MRIDGLFKAQNLNQANVLDILSRLNIGDVIKAKVLEMTSGELLLKLFDGTVFKAAVSSDIDTRPGELLELTVSGKNDGAISLETVKKNIKSESFQNEIKKLLISMDIVPRPENIELAGEFKAAGIRISPEVFTKAAEMIKKFSELTPDKAVFLAAKDIKPEEGRVDSLVKLLEGRLKLGKQLEELQSVISSMEEASPPNVDVSKPVRIPPTPSPTPVYSQPEAGALLLAASKEVAREAPKAAAGVAPSTESEQDADIDFVKSGKLPLKPQEPTFAATVKPQPQAVEEPAPNTVPVTSKTIGADETPQDKIIIKTLIDNALEITRPSTGEIKESGLKVLKNESDDLEKLKTSFKNVFVNTDSKELKSELEVKKMYKDLVEKLDVIKSTVRYSGLTGADDITARVNVLNDGIRLLNQINNSTAYYQIPLNISGFNTTGELYVMKREQSRKRIDPKNVTMFISLDTQNIGRVETIIDIKGKNVSLNLRAEEQQIVDFIKDNCKYLYNSLVDKGYRLVDIKYRLIEDVTNPVNIERNIKRELENGRYSVDMRI